MKKVRILNRKKRLENLIKDGNAPYCTMHKKSINLNDIYIKHCYTGNHGRGYCSKLRFYNG